MHIYQKVQKASTFIKEKLGDRPMPETAMVLGTGLGSLSDEITDTLEIPYEFIPDFPRSTVESHAGSLTWGMLGGKPVWTFNGRFHLYEGYQPDEVVMGIRTVATLSTTNLILTNAAGCLNPQWDAGQIMLITDHINFTGRSPLRGENNDTWGPRFPDMSKVYCSRLRQIAIDQALSSGIQLNKGVYVGVLGPQLETPAETRMLRGFGGDAVGMSTVMEAIAATHMGMNVLGISCLTNKNLPDCMDETSLDDVIAAAEKAGGTMSRLIRKTVQHM